jgi:hypothetical protein
MEMAKRKSDPPEKAAKSKTRRGEKMCRVCGEPIDVPGKDEIRCLSCSAAIGTGKEPPGGEGTVEIARIADPEGNHRVGPDAAIGALARSMATEGQLVAIRVHEHADNKTKGYILAFGRRRIEAATRLGWTHIRAEILPPVDAQTIRQESALENLERANLNALEEAVAVAALLESIAGKRFGPGMDAEAAVEIPPDAIVQAAALLGRSTRWVKDRALLLRLAPAVRDMVANGILPLGQAREIAVLASAEVQEDVAGSAVSEWNGDTRILAVETLRCMVSSRLSTLKGVPWELGISFIGRPACDACFSNTAKAGSLFDDAETPEARCLNLKCYEDKMRAAEKAVRATVRALAKKKEIGATAAQVVDYAPDFVKTAKVARELGKARDPERAEREQERTDATRVPWDQTPEHKHNMALHAWTTARNKALWTALAAKPMALALWILWTETPGYRRLVGWGDIGKAARPKVEAILNRILAGDESLLVELAADFVKEHHSCEPESLIPALCDRLGLVLDPEPKLQTFVAAAEAKKARLPAAKPDAKGKGKKPKGVGDANKDCDHECDTCDAADCGNWTGEPTLA